MPHERALGAAGATARRAWIWPSVAILTSTLVILGPLLRGGYTLAYDMVFAPRMPVGAASLGLGAQVPRSVPSDLVVALASQVLAGDLVQKLVLAALLVLAGSGAARLAPSEPLPRTATALAYLWTPMLGERLLLGQWAVLIGWAVLPWLVSTAAAVRSAPDEGQVRAWCRFVFVLGVMCLGGAPAWLLALLTAPIALAWEGRVLLRAGGCLLALAGYALPWALPALLRPGGVVSDPAGALAFAPASDTPLGVVASLLTGGGVWSGDAAPPGRDSVFSAMALLVVVGLAGFGIISLRRIGAAQWSTVAALGVAAVIGLGIALVCSSDTGARFVAQLTGGALLRDAQRLVVPWVLLVAVGFGYAIAQFRRRAGSAWVGALTVLALLPAAAVPTLGWAVSGRLHTVGYPADFGRIRALVDGDLRSGAVVVLPYAAYRRFEWNGRRVSLDPVDRLIDRTVIISADLPVGAGGAAILVRGEDRLAAHVGDLVSRAAADPRAFAAALGDLGVRWVVVDGGVASATLRGLHPVYRGRHARLYEVPPDMVRHRDPAAGFAAPAWPVIIGDSLALLLLVGSAVGSVSGPARELGRRR